MTSRSSFIALATPAVREALLPVMAALLLGGFVVIGAGFAGPEVLHNAAHDARHALTFPCH